MMKKNTTHTQETFEKLRTIVNIACDWKQQEDWRLGFKTFEEKIKLYSSYMLVTFLVIMLLQLSQLSWTLSPPRILHLHAIWMSWSYLDCYIFNPSPGGETRGHFLVVWLCRSCCAAMWDCLLHSSECEIEYDDSYRAVAREGTCEARLSASSLS